MTNFDARARTWDADPSKSRRARDVADEIRRTVALTPSDTVLEYGCGTGLLGFELQPYVRRIVLADTSTEMLAVLREKIAAARAANMIAVQLDLLRDPPPGDHYDLVCSLMTLHHIPDTAAILARFHDLLAPGGALCLSDLDAEDGSFHGAGAHVHKGFDREDLGRGIERRGIDQWRRRAVPIPLVGTCDATEVTHRPKPFNSSSRRRR